MIGRLKDMVRSRDGREWVVSFSTPCDFRDAFDDLYNKDLEIKISKRYKRRSLDANAFAWALIDQITEKLQQKEPHNGWTVTEVYKNAIKEIGGISEIYGVKEAAFEAFKRLWIGDHIGRQVEVIPGSEKPGWLNVKAWKGSSDFDSLQMSVLISNLIQEAEGLGIHTIPDEGKEKMLSDWSKKYDKVPGEHRSE